MSQQDIRRIESGDRAVEYYMRPLIQVPTWDGKIVLAALFTIAYFALAVYVIKFGGLSSNQKDLALVVLAATGPNLTQIFTALFRTTAAEERGAALRSADLRTAIETPSTVAAPPAADVVEEAVAAGTKRGLGEAEPVKVTTEDRPAADEPLAADGVRRDWLDEPAAGDVDPWKNKS